MAFVQALRAGNRERAEHIAHEIRRVQAEIDRIEHRIRRLLQECRGRYAPAEVPGFRGSGIPGCYIRF